MSPDASKAILELQARVLELGLQRRQLQLNRQEIRAFISKAGLDHAFGLCMRRARELEAEKRRVSSMLHGVNRPTDLVRGREPHSPPPASILKISLIFLRLIAVLMISCLISDSAIQNGAGSIIYFP